MTEEMASGIEELRRLSQAVIDEMERAEVHVLRMNHLLNELIAKNAIEPTMLLGDVIYDTRNKTGIPVGERSLILQAGLGIGSGGIGAIVWSADRYQQLRQDPTFILSETGINFTPFGECPNEVKRLLLPFLAPLIDRFSQLAQR